MFDPTTTALFESTVPTANPAAPVDGPDDETTSSSHGRILPRSTTASRRHTKGLSLNFPILLPNPSPSFHFSPSPTNASSVASPTDSLRNSPHVRPVVFGAADQGTETQQKTKARSSTDFLTLLAAQERKVLELKEELQWAETDLLALKKQWASHEANKKRDDAKQIKKLQPMTVNDVGNPEEEQVEDDVEEQRRRRRAIIERASTTTDIVAPATQSSQPLGRRGSKRVFEGRHTRTLSLLSPTVSSQPFPPPKPVAQPADDLRLTSQGSIEEEDSRSSLSRMPTLDSLMAVDPLQLGFGKTYKDLAAHRRSLPPVAADLLAKHGKQVYDGVKDGLWTFFEDIRQATVGEEGIHGPTTQQRLQRSGSKKPVRSQPTARRKSKSGGAPVAASKNQGPAEPSFWKEFGLDTPHKGAPEPSPVEKTNGHVQQKSSTDSTNTPSLVQDSNDNEDDAWDVWESPVSLKDKVVVDSPKIQAGQELPWPDIKKMTPTKLTRTVSDLMREWETEQGDAQRAPNLSTTSSDPASRELHLDSPLI